MTVLTVVYLEKHTTQNVCRTLFSLTLDFYTDCATLKTLFFSSLATVQETTAEFATEAHLYWILKQQLFRRKASLNAFSIPFCKVYIFKHTMNVSSP